MADVGGVRVVENRLLTADEVSELLRVPDRRSMSSRGRGASLS